MNDSNEFVNNVLERATEVFGSVEKAEEWILKRSGTLGGNPKSLCETEEGYDKVMRHLYGIDLMTNAYD